MKKLEYSLGFTSGAALLKESVIVARHFQVLGKWSGVREKVLEENSFQARTLSTSKRTYREVSKRLGNLSSSALELLAQGDENQVRLLVWLAICRQYPLIRAFALEVILPKYDTANFKLVYEDYDAFLNQKAEWDQSLDNASPHTKNKARQVLFRMLKECCVVGDSGEIQHQYLDAQVVKLITGSNPEDLGIYPGHS